jgi:carboxymethylenebutenolidase
MVDQTIQSRWVNVLNQDLAIAAYLAEPTGAGPFAAVVVIQEIFGVNAHIRDVTERFAQAGYVAIAPAIYQRLAPGYETGYTQADVVQGRQYKEQTKAEELLGDIQATIHYLKSLPHVKPGAIGCIGFCFGGHVAYLAATLPDIKATASFYGAGITTWTPGGDAPTITRTSTIPGTIYAFFGLEDASIPQEQVDQIEAELEKHDIPHRVFRYEGADHGFFCDQRSSYNAAAAADAWQQVLALFQTTL